MALVAPSILSADFANLQSEIEKIEDAGADWVHIDVMDGGFVPNITIGAPVVKTIKPITKLFLDAHLMIFNPENHVQDFVKAGADMVTFHMEAYRYSADRTCLEHQKIDSNFVKRFQSGGESQEDWEARGADPRDYDVEAIKNTIALIREAGAHVGISINPATPVSCLEEVLPLIDMVLLMSVNPGFGGQSFKPIVIEKIKALNEMAAKQGTIIGTNFAQGEKAIEIDGGVNVGEVVESLKAAGANVFVAGSAVYGASDIKATISELKK